MDRFKKNSDKLYSSLRVKNQCYPMFGLSVW